MSAKRRLEALEGYLFLLPNLIGFVIFFAIPLLLSFYYSFTNYDLFTPEKFVGLDNYIKVIGFKIQPEAYQQMLSTGHGWGDAVAAIFQPNDAIFWTAARNTIVYALGVLLFSIIPAFLLAWLLNSQLPGMSIFRGLVYIPVVASVVGVSLVWMWIYQRESGLINYVIAAFFNLFHQSAPDPIGWVTDSNYALLSLIIMTSWATIGYDMVIFLAALQGIPNHLYEAARVDGASLGDILMNIIVPLLTPTIFFVLVTNTIAVLQIFAEPYILTQGGPANSTITLVYYLYQKGFQRFQMGYGASVAWITFGLIFIITIIQFRLSSRWVYEE
jgi:multiple sugar transport system permease protein